MARTRAEVAKLLKKRRGGRSKAEVARAASVELDDPGPGAAAERVLILDRLRALEDQVGTDSQDRDDAYRAVVARLADLEARLAQVERLSAPDGTASHAPREAHPK